MTGLTLEMTARRGDRDSSRISSAGFSVEDGPAGRTDVREGGVFVWTPGEWSCTHQWRTCRWVLLHRACRDPEPALSNAH